MNISSSHVQNTFFLWTLHTTIWHGASNFPRPRVVQSITYNITPSTQGQTAVRIGWCCMWIDWTTRSRGKFNAPCRVAVSQCPEKEGILDMARGNVHFQQHAWGYFAFKRLLWCSDDGSLPLLKKICDSMGFRAANPLRVDYISVHYRNHIWSTYRRQGPDRWLFFCAAFTSYYEENDRGDRGQKNNSKKNPD